MSKKNIEISIPTDLSDITLGKHQLLNLLLKDGLDEDKMAIKMIGILCGLTDDEVRGLPIDDFNYINTLLVNMLNKKSSFISRFTLNDIEYGFIPNLDEITLGEYVDIDSYIKDYEDMHKVMTILYRPIIAKSFGKYEIAKYTGKEDSDIMKDMPLSVANGAMVFFLQFRERLIDSYDGLFGDGDGETSSIQANFGARWGWYNSIYGIAKGDITKFDEATELNIHKAFTFLSFEKDKNETEATIIRNSSKQR